MTNLTSPFRLLLSELRVKSFKEGRIAQRSDAGKFPRHAGRLCGAIRKWEYHYGLHHFHPEFYAMWGAAPPIPTSDKFRIWEQQILLALEGMGNRVIITANEEHPRSLVGFEHLNITNNPEIPYYAMDNITVYSACNWWSMVFADPALRPMPSRNFHWYFLPLSTPIYLTSGPPTPRVKAILEQVHKSTPTALQITI